MEKFDPKDWKQTTEWDKKAQLCKLKKIVTEKATFYIGDCGKKAKFVVNQDKFSEDGGLLLSVVPVKWEKKEEQGSDTEDIF